MSKRIMRVLGGVVLAALLLFVGYEAYAVWRAQTRTPEVVARARSGELQLSDLTPRRRAMLLAVEDPGFTQHNGWDASTPGQGRTNITQALVKRFYFDRFEPGFAKIEQSLIARFVLHPALSKDEQLRAFLNHASFAWNKGEPVIGFADAARTYHGRDFTQLDDRQFLSLVAMLMAPRTYNPLTQPAANAERVRRIERLLAGACRPTGLTDVSYEACADPA